MRKAFNFFNSYWQTANELNDKDRLAFYDALFYFQFTGDSGKLKNLTGIAKIAYISQRHSIDNQVKGYIDKCKDLKINPFNTPAIPPAVGGAIAPSIAPSIPPTIPPARQVQGKGKGKGEEESLHQLAVDFWLNEFHPGWKFNGLHGKKIKSILEDLKRRLKLSGKDCEDSDVLDAFKKFCLNLPPFYQDKDLSILESKMNEIIEEIKKKKDTEQKKANNPRPFVP